MKKKISTTISCNNSNDELIINDNDNNSNNYEFGTDNARCT